MKLFNSIKQNVYFDSVSLMVLSSNIAGVEGIKDAAVMMATDSNKALMVNAGLYDPANGEAGSSDMIIGILAEGEDAVEKARQIITEFMENKSSDVSGDEIRTKTLDSAVKRDPASNFAVISVPGRYAKTEAMKALNHGMHVLLFSDNVTIDEENALKDKALEKGLLMMGPDCGTAIINGVGLGFANAVKRGSIGLVAAAGTGLQEAVVIIDRLGGGVSQALGTGGRDVKDAVGGKMMMQGIRALDADPATELIVIVSKPPAEKVMAKVLETIRSVTKPVVACFLGGDPSIVKSSGAIFAETLEDAAVSAVRITEGKTPENVFFTISDQEARDVVLQESGKLAPGQNHIRGLYSGGTICYEAMLILRETIGDVHSNVPLRKDLELAHPEESLKNTFVDMGEDFFTDGMPHPMIDTRLRIERIRKEAQDPSLAVILLDVVLGYGSHEDPAGSLLPVIREAKAAAEREERHLSVVASICGTEGDPQVRSDQEKKLLEAGVVVMPSNAQAARMASLIASKGKYLDELLGGE